LTQPVHARQISQKHQSTFLPEAVHVDRWSGLVLSLRITREANLSAHVKSM